MKDESAKTDVGHGRRVSKILDRARHETGVRDLVTFSGARMWTVLLALAAILYVLLDGAVARASINKTGAETSDLNG